MAADDDASAAAKGVVENCLKAETIAGVATEVVGFTRERDAIIAAVEEEEGEVEEVIEVIKI